MKKQVAEPDSGGICPLSNRPVVAGNIRDLCRAAVTEALVRPESDRRVRVARDTASQHGGILDGHATALAHIRSRRMRRITEQRASSVAPPPYGSAVVDASFDDRSRVGSLDYFRNRRMPIPEQA